MSATAHLRPSSHSRQEPSCFSTRQIHHGQGSRAGAAGPTVTPAVGVVPPVHLAAAYEFTSLRDAREAFAQREPGFTYARTGSPTVALLEQRLAALEGGTGAVATASGQAAIALTLLALAGRSGQSADGLPHPGVPAGHVVASSRIYGGTADLLNDSLAEAGITVTWADPHALDEWERAVDERTRALLVESIGNPHGDLPDLAALADLARREDIPLVVDNTLATPYLFRPGEHGADFVVHSTTKYLTGNGTALGGAVVDTGRFSPEADPARWPQFTAGLPRFGGVPLTQRYGDGAVLHLIRAKYLHDLGPCAAPWNAQQTLEGIETLDVRMDRHCRVAEELARRLQDHPGVARVRHPSLPQDPNGAVAARDFPRGTGAVLSFELTAGPSEVERFIDSLQLIKLAANIGDSRTMVAHPASMTHCRLSEALREAGAITEQTIRLSVGREDVEDLWRDLRQAFDRAGLTEAQNHHLITQDGAAEALKEVSS
ncbi:O-acetylhomoserine aminocarboxypropyltransferase/cysteine synthase family protein [Nesterenkonia massiliensis]|uniref:O-acetylhomoserine aminocarboxypropyltransferase/cysteine synthase family protein n=1 Tax=Nesterenkonia massiliensis TaxID=1232429 RepID=UPI0004260DA3|nr:aminotransferase class I/II-fold pyridoxal phosphate-dependent enzyme [Nesterenkonia massiliensis]